MNRVLAIVAFAGFGSALFMRSVDPVIPQIADDLWVQASTAALLSTAFAVPYAFIQPVLGAAADMVGKARLMNACLLVLVIVSLLSAASDSFALLFALRIVAGVASGGVFPIALALVGDLVPVKQRQVAIGRLLAATMTGNLIGATGAGFIGDLFGWRGVFVATALAGLAVLVATVTGLRGMERRGAAARASMSDILPNYRAIFTNPLAKYCFGAVLIEGIFLFGVFPHLAAMLQAEGETRASIAGIVIAGFGIGGLSYTFLVGWLLGQMSERRMMFSGGTLMGIGLVVLALRTPWQVEMLNFFVLGIAFYLLHGVIQVYVTELAPQARGSATALHSAFFFFGQSIGPIYYGFAFAQVGTVPALLLGGAAVFAAGAICALKLRHAAPGRGTGA